MSVYRALIWLKSPDNRLWVKPAVGSVVAVLIAMVAAVGNRLIPAGLLPDIERSTLDNLLGVIASSMLGVATFSLSIMVAAFSSAAAGASPRAIQLVAGDADTQNAITTFISAFIYAIIANTALGLGLYGSTGRFILFVCTMGPDGHRKLLHLWPVKLLQAGRSDYDYVGVMAMREAASFRR